MKTNIRWFNLNPDKTVSLLPEGMYTDFTNDRKVANDTVGEAMVSTVFLGMDHDILQEESSPILFETMIFGGEHDDYMRRYHTYDEAQSGHHKIVKALHMGIDPDTLFNNPENEQQ